MEAEISSRKLDFHALNDTIDHYDLSFSKILSEVNVHLASADIQCRM